MLTALSVLLACSGPPAVEPTAPPPGPAPRLDVRATCPSAAWLARAVGGSRVDVADILPPGEDPALWRPSPAQISALAEADLIVANGANYEPWLATATLPQASLVLTASGVEDPIILNLPPHRHGAQGLHSHVGTDPHTWLDPVNFQTQGRVLRDALVRLDPDHMAIYDSRLEGLGEDLRAIDESYVQALAPLKGVPIAANHPAYGYLARRYGLAVTALAFDPTTPPDAEQLAPFTAWLQSAGEAPILLWEVAPTQAVKAAFPPAVRHAWIDTLEQAPEGGSYDYLRQTSADIKVFQALSAE